MYQGALFKKAYEYCSTKKWEIWILSAKYGLLSPEELIPPYELTLNTLNKQKRKVWADLVQSQIKNKNLDGEFVYFAGEKYVEFLNGDNRPLNGLSLGMQLHWFNSQKKQKLKGFLF